MDLKVVTIISKQEAEAIPARRVMLTRYVLTNKCKTGDEIIAQARLVVGGHRDPDLDHLRTDAPTADTLAISIILILSASKRWTIQSGDVTTAFLSGVEDHRYLRPSTSRGPARCRLR